MCSIRLDSNSGGSHRTCFGLKTSEGFRQKRLTVVDFLIVGMSDIKESQNIASLHNQITACDSILEVRKTTHSWMKSQYKGGRRTSLTIPKHEVWVDCWPEALKADWQWCGAFSNFRRWNQINWQSVLSWIYESVTTVGKKRVYHLCIPSVARL